MFFQLIECKECKEGIVSMLVTCSISVSGYSDCVIAEVSSYRCILSACVSPVGGRDVTLCPIFLMYTWNLDHFELAA